LRARRAARGGDEECERSNSGANAYHHLSVSRINLAQ
jgi:hypothetical protein